MTFIYTGSDWVCYIQMHMVLTHSTFDDLDIVAITYLPDQFSDPIANIIG